MAWCLAVMEFGLACGLLVRHMVAGVADKSFVAAASVALQFALLCYMTVEAASDLLLYAVEIPYNYQN